MKNILLIMFIFLSLLACSGGKTVQLPDKNLEIKDNKIYYNGGLFTGEIKAIDKESGAEEPGRFSATVKNGEIEGKVALLAEDTDFTYNIKDGKIAGAALDVVENEPLDASSPFWKFENVTITPHNSWVSDQVDIRRFNIS